MKFCVVLLMAILSYASCKPPSCDDAVPFSTSFTGTCTNKWKNLKPILRPTQPGVGWAWVQRKLDKDFTKESDAQDEMDDLSVPCVLGPGNLLYAVDSHHTLTALDLSGWEDTKVTVEVLCDLRALTPSDFWEEMEERSWVYLLSAADSRSSGLPTPISPSDLPDEFAYGSFANDYYRSLSAFVRKVKNETCPSDDEYCERCYDRVCSEDGGGIPFFEFRWGYFFNDATFGASGGWASEDDRDVFVKLFEKADTDSDIGEVDVEGWENAAEALIPLCREGGAAIKYELPGGVLGGGALPGAVDGWIELEEDPVCDEPLPCAVVHSSIPSATVPSAIHERVQEGVEAEGGTEGGGSVVCGDCYGAGDEGECCDTCDDVWRAYRRKGWVLNDKNDVSQCMREGSTNLRG